MTPSPLEKATVLVASKVGYGGICLTKTDRGRYNITSVGEGLGPPETSNFAFPREEQAPPLPDEWVITPINRNLKGFKQNSPQPTSKTAKTIAFSNGEGAEPRPQMRIASEADEESTVL